MTDLARKMVWRDGKYAGKIKVDMRVKFNTTSNPQNRCHDKDERDHEDGGDDEDERDGEDTW